MTAMTKNTQMPVPARPTPVLAESADARILLALRRIVRQVELSSKTLEVEHGITTPQLLSLLTICEYGQITQAQLSKHVLLSASTLVGVLDRLESKGLIQRQRDTDDRRRIFLVPTEHGRTLVTRAPVPLHERLIHGLSTWPVERRDHLATELTALVDLLGARDIDDSSVLAPGPIPQPLPEVR